MSFALAMVISATLLCELWAGAQEELARRAAGPNPAAGIYVKRWPPFQGNGIFYTPGVGWQAHD